MATSNDNRESVIDSIIDLEQDMFTAVNNRGGESPCQQRLKTFRLMRWMTHSVHKLDYLESYLQDLQEAKKADRNLMTEKYGRMEGLIPSNVTPEISFTVDTEATWMDELKTKYPRCFSQQGQGFKTYAASELQTLSSRSMELYYNEVKDALAAGRNLLQERYENLYRRLGYASLDLVEQEAENKAKSE